jgi:glycosyltransferase involved in cell wall biosynthesis
VADIGKSLPEADAVIATWWETVEAVNQAPPSKGRKFHLLQGHEVFPYLPARSADVHRLPFHKIAVSGWLMNLMRENYGSTDVSLVVNPVDTDRFGWVERQRAQVPTVGTVFGVTPVKNSAMAFEAVRLAREQIPDLRLVAFGADALPSDFQSLPFVEYHERPAQEAIPDVYRSADFWLFTSTEEGFGLPILEAMAVGTPVIATPAGAAPDLVTEKTGALVSLDPAEMARAIVRLFSEPEEKWFEMSRESRSTAEAHDVESAVSEFEAIVCG